MLRHYITKSAKKSEVEKKWLIIDAESQVLGRLASKVAYLLRGKHKSNFTPHVDCGDNVIVINAEKVRLTGNKLTKKKYISHTGYPGGQREKTPTQYLAYKPNFLVEHAIKGMLPKNRLGRDMFRNLKVYSGDKHPHGAQNPVETKL